MKKDCNTECVTQGEIQEITCTARLNVQAYHIKHIKTGKENFVKPNLVSGFVRKGLF